VQDYGQPPRQDPPAPPPAKFYKEGDVPPNVAVLVDQIAQLNIIEVGILTDALSKKLNMPSPQEMIAKVMAGGVITMGAGIGSGGTIPGAPAATAAPTPAAGGAPAEEKKKEEKKQDEKKDIFTLKLVKVAEDAKFKVLKEVRAIRPGMTVSDSKKFVENLPSILKEAVPKEEAMKWVEKIKEAGGELKLE